ncbi:MAG: hypothetical protein ABR559_04805 [Gemmatimonadota bacterium]
MGGDHLDVEVPGQDEPQGPTDVANPSSEEADQDGPRDEPVDDPFEGIPSTFDAADPVDEWLALSPSERALRHEELLRIDDGTEDPSDDPHDADVPADIPLGEDEPSLDDLQAIANREDPRAAPPFEPPTDFAKPFGDDADGDDPRDDDVPPETPLPVYDPLGEADDGTDDPRDADPAPPKLGPGVYVTPAEEGRRTGIYLEVDDPMIDSVILGQTFDVNMGIATVELDKDGDGRPDRESIEVTLATADGDTETVTLYWNQQSYDGVFVFGTRNPISIAGEAWNLDVGGTITELELENYQGAKQVKVSAEGFETGLGTIDVYTDDIQLALGRLGATLDIISNVIAGEQFVIRQLRQDAEVTADPAMVKELDDWQARVDGRLAMLSRARAALARDDYPAVKLQLGQFYLQRLTARENGEWTVAEDVVPLPELVNPYYEVSWGLTNQTLDIIEGRYRQRFQSGTREAILDEVVPGYVLGAYDAFTKFNIPGTFAWTMATGTDAFGQEKSRLYAAAEMGAFIVVVKLPSSVAEWGAGGFRANRLPFEIGIPRLRGVPLRGNVVVPTRAGRLARDTEFGLQSYPGTGPRRLSQAERDFWTGRVAAKTPLDRLDAELARTNRDLDELGSFVLKAQRAGVSYAQIEAALARGRSRGNLSEAIASVRTELAVRAAEANGMTILVQPAEMADFLAYSGGHRPANLRQEDLLMIHGIKSRAEFEARHGGKPSYSPDEVKFAQDVLLTNKAELKRWVEFADDMSLKHLFNDAAIRDLEIVFGGGGPPAGRISASRGLQNMTGRQPRPDRGWEGEVRLENSSDIHIDSGVSTPGLPGAGGRAQGGRPPTQELSPAEIERAILEAETVRLGRAAPGQGPAPAGQPAPAPRDPAVRSLDAQVVQKAFRFAAGEKVEWSAQELTRLQQLAYPASGTRPTALQERLMPVAEQLGGRLKTLRQDRDAGAMYAQADRELLAHQEMEDLAAIARRVGVSDETIRLHTEGMRESSPVASVVRASRGLMREIDRARGVIHESGVPDDFFVVTRIYVAARGNGNTLSPGDVAWLRARLQQDPRFFENLPRREFMDATGEPFHLLDPAGARDLKSMYERATGEHSSGPIGETGARVIDATTDSALALGGPSGVRGRGTIEVVVASTGGSTGPVMEMYVVNHGQPVRIQGEGVVLERIENPDPITLERIEQIRRAVSSGKPLPPPGNDPRGAGPLPDPWASPNVVRVALDAYCLQFDMEVPTAGTVFRIAAPAKQAAHARMRSILVASRSLHERGALHPDSDPTDHFHSIRQWAIWVDEKDLDQRGFEDALVEHTRRNVAAANQEWSDEIERMVREIAPNRWRDITAILDESRG